MAGRRRRVAHDHEVALEILVPRYRGRLDREQRLLNEAQFAQRVGEHPALPRLYGSGRLQDLDGCPYVALEVVHGSDLNTAAAVNAVDDGQQAVIVVHELDGGTPYTAAMGVTIAGGKTIALLAAPGELPIIQGTGVNPGLRVEGAETIRYIDGVQVSGAGVQGIVADTALAWLDRSRVVNDEGDPLTDIDGDPRPTMDGAADYAGADVPVR